MFSLLEACLCRVSYTLAKEENNSIEAAGPSLAPAVAPFADSPVDVYLDLDEWLQPSLCEIACATILGPAIDKQLRKQRVATLRARWIDQPFTRLSWLPVLPRTVGLKKVRGTTEHI